jgi:REG-2-like HAD superfamily hydrolase
MAKPIKLMTFDAWETLIHPRIPVFKQYVETARRHGLTDLDEAQIKQKNMAAIRRFTQELPHFGYQASHTSEQRSEQMDTWWTKVIQSTFEPISPKPDLIRDLIQRFNGKEAYSLRPRAAETLATLKSRGFMLGVISNCDSRIVNVLRELSILDKFAFTTLSADCGFAKPDNRIFDRALEQARACLKHDEKLAESTHVGDDWSKDIVGATQAKWKAICLDEAGVYDESYARHVPKIRAISDLVDLTALNTRTWTRYTLPS